MAWSTPPTFVSGTPLPAADLNTLSGDLAVLGGAWAAFTPTWTASTTNPTLGNGTLVGRYMQAGKLVFFTIDLTIGSGTLLGSGQYLFTLPATAVRGAELAISATLTMKQGTNRNSGGAILVNTGTVRLMQATGAVTPSSPFAWASGDVISLAGQYEAV